MNKKKIIDKLLVKICSFYGVDPIPYYLISHQTRYKFSGLYDSDYHLIGIDPELGIVDLTKTLIHEVTHSMQDLSDYEEVLENVSYENHPLEIEAELAERDWKKILYK